MDNLDDLEESYDEDEDFRAPFVQAAAPAPAAAAPAKPAAPAAKPATPAAGR